MDTETVKVRALRAHDGHRKGAEYPARADAVDRLVGFGWVERVEAPTVKQDTQQA